MNWNKFLHNTLLFLSPVVLIYLAFVVIGIENNGIQWADFVPKNTVIGAMVLYVINVIVDFLRKIR